MSESGTGPSVEGPRPAPSGEGSVTVVGTAHVSAESADEVTQVVTERRPDIVAVELDESRYRQLQGDAPDDLDPKDLLKGSVVFQLLSYWLLSYVQTRLGERFGVEPGADMRAAISAAEETGAAVALVDRDIQTTIQRLWAKMTFIEKLRLGWALAWGMVGLGGGTVEEDFDVENLTDVDVVTALIEELREFSPGGTAALIDERDAFIAHRLVALREQGYHVVAVVGAGHREGIERYLRNPDTLPAVSELVGRESRRISVGKVVGVVFTVGYLAFFGLLVLAGLDNLALLEVFAAWFLFNGIFAFTAALLVGAHWTSALVGGAIAWLTSLNPLLAPGWFAGYVELRRRPVNISDISRLNTLLDDDERSLRELLDEMFEVPLFRLVAVVAMTNVGSIIASVLFPIVVLPFVGPFDSLGAVTAALERGLGNGIDILSGLLP